MTPAQREKMWLCWLSGMTGAEIRKAIKFPYGELAFAAFVVSSNAEAHRVFVENLYRRAIQ